MPAVLLFGLPPTKDEIGSARLRRGRAGAEASARSTQLPDMVVITDVCLCEYTSHGHCGVLEERHRQRRDGRAAGACGAVARRGGAHIVAPSDMMDGRVGAIRPALDERGFDQVAIMSYAAKYCSGFYGPFREAADSAPQFGDRRSHQMDPANAEEALREVELDIDEGADIVMVKPAMPYLDILWRVKERSAIRLRRTR